MKEKKLELAIKFVVEKFSNKEELIKPTLFHSIRVGMYLYDNGYDTDTCIAGFLHDVIEDTDLMEKEIEKLFGSNVLTLIKANTEDINASKETKREELISRCANTGQNALIIKCADIIDNYGYWSKQQRDDQIQRCLNLANLVTKHRKEEYNDKIFIKLLDIFA